MSDAPAVRPEKSTTGRSKSSPLPLLRLGLRLAQTLAPPVAVRVAESLWFTSRGLRLKEAEATVLQRGRAFQVPLDGEVLQGWSWGQGPTVLLVHGWAGRAGQMTPLAEALVAAGLRAVAVDLPAHGASGGKRTHAVQMARALLAVAEVAGPVHAVVAHSFGAVAATLALERGLRAERVVFLGPPAGFDAHAEKFCRMLGIAPGVWSRVRARVEAAVGAPWDDIQPRTLAPRMTAPLLVLHDSGDREVLLSEGEQLSRAWPGARLEVTHGLGHYRILREAGVHARVLGFLRAGMAGPEVPVWAPASAPAPAAQLGR